MGCREVVNSFVAITSVMCNYIVMVIAQSKVTAQGQISVPAEVRRKLGLGPGSVLEWNAEGEKIVVKRATLHSSQELHQKVFGQSTDVKSISELKEGIKQNMQKRYAKR
jgi:antitoxin PrlF